mmetsp:Transcript_3166/g.10968  ORF Transcript_3166/g.10968 Transcript_3166/m.10968 type:complete len:208 (+) Transcript_3166:33-656(+)
MKYRGSDHSQLHLLFRFPMNLLFCSFLYSSASSGLKFFSKVPLTRSTGRSTLLFTKVSRSSTESILRAFLAETTRKVVPQTARRLPHRKALPAFSLGYRRTPRYVDPSTECASTTFCLASTAFSISVRGLAAASRVSGTVVASFFPSFTENTLASWWTSHLERPMLTCRQRAASEENERKRCVSARRKHVSADGGPEGLELTLGTLR